MRLSVVDLGVVAPGTDEAMIQNMIADPADRCRSHELLAEAFDLTPAKAALR